MGEPAGQPVGEPPGRSNGDGTSAPLSRPVEPDPERDADARQLARSLIADIAYADQARLREARAAGTVLTAFQKPIAQAWAFYCDRVGTSFARQSPHFRQAVQDLLGGDGDD